MKLKWFLLTILISATLIGCSVTNTQVKVSEVSSNPIFSQVTNDNPVQSNAIRGEGISKFGALKVIPLMVRRKLVLLVLIQRMERLLILHIMLIINIAFKDFSNEDKVIGTIDKQNIPAIIQPKDTIVKMNK